MENEMNINELIKIEQLPKVFEQLEKIGEWVDNGIANLNLSNLVYDEEHKQDIKKIRTEINNITKTLETKRKEIKNKILEPYQLFEEKYTKEVKTKLENTYNLLTDKIDEIEDNQKKEKENELRKFFDNYQEQYHLEEIIKYEDVGLNITLSASEKSLKDQIVQFFKKVSDDFQCISSDENREEILIEYKRNGFNYSQAVNTINDKINQIKELEEKLKEKDAIDIENQKVIENVKTLVSAPIEIKEEQELITCQFTITSTREKIKKLKEYLIKEDIKYE